MRETYCVVYRTGGTVNFRWQRTLAMPYDDAIRTKEETERMGYKAMVVKYRLSVCAGLPETYEYVKPFA